MNRQQLHEVHASAAALQSICSSSSVIVMLTDQATASKPSTPSTQHLGVPADGAAAADSCCTNVCCCCSTFNIPYSRSASFDDNLAFFKEVLAELQRWAQA
jgi:hypothetical protein